MRSGILGIAIGGFGFVTIAIVNVLFHRWLVRRVGVRPRPSAIGLAILVACYPIGRVLVAFGLDDRWMWLEAVGQLWGLTLLVALPIVGLFELVRFLLRRGSRTSARPAAGEAETRAPVVEPSRRDVLTTLGGGLAVVAAGAPLGWGLVRTRFDVEVTEIPIRIARLPKALDGYTIVQVSDVHVGPFLGERELRRAEETIARLKSDLVVMTGDLVHLRPEWLPLAADWLARLGARPRGGVTAILGNHEYYVGRAACVAALSRAGVPLLINAPRILEEESGGGIVLAGVDDAFGARTGHPPRLDLAFAGVSAERPRILLAHQPQIHVEAAAHGVDLQLSGHTHGGQIAPLGPVVAGAIFGPYVGLHAFGATRLYVNRGFGTSGPPSRVAVRPEITKIVLVAG
jgi:predicted MPP superfamily phosphohydrolase